MQYFIIDAVLYHNNSYLPFSVGWDVDAVHHIGLGLGWK